MRWILALAAAPVLLLDPVAVRAQGPPIQTDTPIMLGLEGRGVRTALGIVRLDDLLQDGDEIADPLDRSATAIVLPFAVPYNLSPTLQAGAVVPFVSRELESGGTEIDRSGLGDVTVFLKKLVAQIDGKGETFRVAVKGSVKLPTGDQDGSPPLGTGSTDPGLSAVAGWVKGRWGLYGEAFYTHNSANGGVDYGDRFGANTAVGFRAVPTVYRRYPSRQLNVYLEVNSQRTERTAVDGVENPDSGGSLVFLSPGIQFVGGRRWLLEGSLQLPVLDEPNGTQLGTGWVAVMGARVLVF